VLLARCQAEILAEKKPDEPDGNEQNKPIISIEEWRPPEPAHVEKVRLARRSGRYARYQQVVALHEQGMRSQEIAKLIGLSDRTVRDWLLPRNLSRSEITAQKTEFL
jgi:transposase